MRTSICPAFSSTRRKEAILPKPNKLLNSKKPGISDCTQSRIIINHVCYIVSFLKKPTTRKPLICPWQINTERDKVLIWTVVRGCYIFTT